MSARYRIKPCRTTDCGIEGRHVTITTPVGGEFLRPTLSEAIEVVARAEAYRLAGDDWTLEELLDGRILLERRPGITNARFRSWEQVALFLKDLRAAGRKPLDVAS